MDRQKAASNCGKPGSAIGAARFSHKKCDGGWPANPGAELRRSQNNAELSIGFRTPEIDWQLTKRGEMACRDPAARAISGGNQFLFEKRGHASYYQPRA